MKLLKITTFVIAALLMVACDDTTDTIGDGITNRQDGISVADAVYNVETQSIATGSVLSNNSNGIIGMAKDPETNSYVTGDLMAQFSTLSSFQLDTLDYIKYAHGGDFKDGAYVGGELQADSCYILVNYSTTYGDTLAPMKVTAYELNKPLEEGQSYYTNFDPIEKGYVNTEDGYKVSTTYSLKNNYFKIYLDKPYRSKVDGKDYPNYGSYIMNMRHDHPEYFKNNYQFVHHVCPGFFIKHENGIGNMAKISSLQLVFCWERKKHLYSYDGLRDSSETKNYSYPFYSTAEVLQTNTINYNQSKIDELVSDGSCTYLKSPAGILTEATLPVEQIMQGHEKDSLALVTVTFPRINNQEDSQYAFSTPSDIMMVPVDSLTSFFENGDIINYRTSFTASYNSNGSSAPKNAYTFNNISNLITEMYKVPVAERTANWNKVVLIPVSITYVTRDNYQYISRITHNMGLSSTRLVKGDNSTDAEGKPASPIQVKVIYSKFNENE